MPFLNHYRSESHLKLLSPVRPRDRIVAQLVDGFLLWICTALLLLLFSNGSIRTIWISPVIPFYLLEVGEAFTPGAADWLWGGAYIQLNIPHVKTLFIQLPAPLLWCYLRILLFIQYLEIRPDAG